MYECVCVCKDLKLLLILRNSPSDPCVVQMPQGICGTNITTHSLIPLEYIDVYIFVFIRIYIFLSEKYEKYANVGKNLQAK